MTETIQGPWTMGEMNVADIDGFRVHRIPISGRGVAIAAVWCGSVGQEYMGGPARGRAHAELIAAAPAVADAARAMLAALESISAWWLTDDPIKVDGAAAFDAMRETIEQAKAAGITTP